jgi:hypothetical protein
MAELVRDVIGVDGLDVPGYIQYGRVVGGLLPVGVTWAFAASILSHYDKNNEVEGGTLLQTWIDSMEGAHKLESFVFFNFAKRYVNIDGPLAVERGEQRDYRVMNDIKNATQKAASCLEELDPKSVLFRRGLLLLMCFPEAADDFKLWYRAGQEFIYSEVMHLMAGGVSSHNVLTVNHEGMDASLYNSLVAPHRDS